MSKRDPIGSRRLQLNKVHFGSLDARAEVLSRDPAKLQHFKDSFVEPAGISVEEFLKGDRFIIHGMKGSGKAAFLRYTQLKAEEKHCITKFITFSNVITDALKDKLIQNASLENFMQEDLDPGKNAVSAWVLFVLQQIGRIIEENRRIFTSHQDIKQYTELMKRLSSDGEQSLLSWLLQVVKKGKYRITAKIIRADLKGEDGDKSVDFDLDYIIEHAFDLLKNLSWEGASSIFIYFDELNLSFASREQNKKDSILIRDLLVAVNRMNEYFMEQHKPIFVVAAVRTEVLNAVSVPTHEINKILFDRGREIRWFGQTAGDVAPIVRLFESKIRASEKQARAPVSKDVLSAYFRRSVFGMSPSSFIVDLSWCNPRDLILLFGEAAKRADLEEFFDESLFGKIVDEYSRNAWHEKVEELNVSYAPIEIKSLKAIMTGFRKYFKIGEFESEGERKARVDQHIQQFLKKRQPARILEDLFRVGIIGQSTKRPDEHGTGLKQFQEHWLYRGDGNFDPAAYMVVHKALWADLRLGKIQSNF